MNITICNNEKSLQLLALHNQEMVKKNIFSPPNFMATTLSKVLFKANYLNKILLGSEINTIKFYLSSFVFQVYLSFVLGVYLKLAGGLVYILNCNHVKENTPLF